MTVISTDGLALAAEWGTDEVTASTLPVDLSTSTYRTVSRLIIPAAAGDVLSVNARARVTNDTGRNRGEPGYTVGVGYHLWAYDCDSGQGTAGPWTRISSYNGDNVSRDRHHMPLHITTTWRVPATWPDGHRIVVVLRADAHSTAWRSGDILTVDQEYGHLAVRRWTGSDV
ncbi:hypothetical protein OG875_04670 [Streptomyces sp. NBC_01498]|uniref:hypothetical protein n=1 Tax=Streptomyces sp. NBC_01498 TaxID=2975870 RepID=UPI002E7B3022|nr:hypothetical protein [Streptomyces sp. NBC_01498]WTL23949.1 hypothetical protein OG875_04670 [Streptomyces sp. NBC_01498]